MSKSGIAENNIISVYTTLTFERQMFLVWIYSTNYKHSTLSNMLPFITGDIYTIQDEFE